MIKAIKSECKIIECNFYLITVGLAVLLLILSLVAGKLVNLSYMAFEILFPLYTAIAIGEWGKMRTDENYDVIAAQSKSLYKWVTARFIAIFGIVSVLAVISMIFISHIRGEVPFCELLLIYFSTAFFLSSISVLIALCSTTQHMATLICGMIWLIALMTSSLLRFTGVEYVYLFIRYADDMNDIWIWNKVTLFTIGIIFWVIVYIKCKRN